MIGTETKWAKHDFSPGELLAISRDMAQAEAKKREMQDNLKAMKSNMSAEIDQAESVIHLCAERIRSGYEMRPHECKVEYMLDNLNVRFVDIETGEVIAERLMTKDEQLKLSSSSGAAEQPGA